MHKYPIKLTAPITQAALPIMDVTADLQIYGCPLPLFNRNPSTRGSSNGGYGYWPRQIIERVDPDYGALWEIDAVSHTLPRGAV